MKCQIKWLDKAGNETPDARPVVAVAFCACSHCKAMADSTGQPLKAFPICQEHLDNLPADWRAVKL